MTDARTWYDAFRRTVCREKFADPLRGAARAGRLGEWTRLLTAVVIETCGSLGWIAAAREHIQEILPVVRQEYLGLDVTAFEGPLSQDGARWRLPVAVFELENRDDLSLITYSVWKACVVRCRFRAVFCYRRGPQEIPSLVTAIAESVTGLEENRVPLLLVVGTRSKAETFPDGFFRPYQWDRQWRRFRSLL